MALVIQTPPIQKQIVESIPGQNLSLVGIVKTFLPNPENVVKLIPFGGDPLNDVVQNITIDDPTYATIAPLTSSDDIVNALIQADVVQGTAIDEATVTPPQINPVPEPPTPSPFQKL